MKKTSLAIFLFGFSSLHAEWDFVCIGPNIQFKNGFRIYSVGLEISYWPKISGDIETNKGIDFGIEVFRNIESMVEPIRHKRVDSKFRNNFRFYSEFQIGQIFYGISGGPFFELHKGFFENNYNFGIQSTVWGNPILGLNLRPTLSLDGFGYSYGAYFRAPYCDEPCLSL